MEVINMGYSCCGENSCAPRHFKTKEEKVEMLSEYKEALVKEAKGVEEKISELKKG